MAIRTHCDGCNKLLCEVVNAEIVGGNHAYEPLPSLRFMRGNICIFDLNICPECVDKLLPMLPEVAKKAIEANRKQVYPSGRARA